MIRILVDSSSDYKMEEIREKGLELVPITITIGETDYIDGKNLGRDEFYEILKETGEFPKTSQPSPQAFLEVFLDAKKNDDELVCILLSSALSGTCQSALLAKSMASYDKIYIIDSLSATYTIKILADYALTLASQGIGAGEIAARLESLRSRVKVLAAPDTLDFLQKGGRVSKTAAAIGNLAGIKPIITISPEGQVAVIGKCVGRNKAISQILKQLAALGRDENFPLYPIYSYGTENCTKLCEKLAAAGYRIDEMLQIGPTIGTHIGPEAFGIVFAADERGAGS
ncbi:MAG: DegV family protein [Lachnospiraceae bacterium]|jgi:DegV family protein with EDD domain|nr:DegV family protein [Lachnospiraceae bacterium]